MAPAQTVESNSGTRLLPFTVTRVGTADVSVSFSYSVGASSPKSASGGSACKSGIDFVTVATTALTLAATSTTQTINVTICGDMLVEPDETFLVTLSAPSAGARLDPNGTAVNGTIVNDDGVVPTTGASDPYQYLSPDSGDNPTDSRASTL